MGAPCCVGWLRRLRAHTMAAVWAFCCTPRQLRCEKTACNSRDNRASRSANGDLVMTTRRLLEAPRCGDFTNGGCALLSAVATGYFCR